MGIMMDWSDAEGKGLKAAIGDELASELLRFIGDVLGLESGSE